MMNKQLANIVDRGRGGRVVVLTGAGISAESGIPTFRGAEGYWTVGAQEYRPQQMATHAAFERMPRDVWHWYLYRWGVCRGAEPNAAHAALVQLEQTLGDRFRLVTQNVDGLHLRAGNSSARTDEVHGNIDFLRCANDCCAELFALPDGIVAKGKDDPLTDDEFDRLVCPRCAGPARPHVLWFDECYREDLYGSDSAMAAAGSCDLLIVVGASGAASLPMHATAAAAEAKAGIIDVNPSDNPFAKFAVEYAHGHWAKGTAGEWLPQFTAMLT